MRMGQKIASKIVAYKMKDKSHNKPKMILLVVTRVQLFFLNHK